MRAPVIPVANGMIPRADQDLTGVFSDEWTKKVFLAAGNKRSVLLLPIDPATGIYPVGSLVTARDAWTQQVMTAPSFAIREAVFATFVGKGTFRASSFSWENGILVAEDVTPLDLGELRTSYPLIDGSGWTPSDGATDSRSLGDIRVSIFGRSHEGDEVVLEGNLGSLVSPEAAHTLEHAIIRSLSRFAMVTVKTLRHSIAQEVSDLKASLELGYSLRMPEFFGVTSTGMCGNPLTGLAQFYLADELRKRLASGMSLPRSVEGARLTALSRVTGDLGLSTEKGVRVLEGLKRGMMHDDSALSDATLKRVLRRFPLSPFE